MPAADVLFSLLLRKDGAETYKRSVSIPLGIFSRACKMMGSLDVWRSVAYFGQFHCPCVAIVHILAKSLYNVSISKYFIVK